MNVAVTKTKTKAEQALLSNYEAAANALPGTSAVAGQRRDAMSQFNALGLPSRRIEDWKYTDLRAIMKTALPLAVHDHAVLSASDLAAALGHFASIDAHRVVFANGRHVRDLDVLDGAQGVTVTALADTLGSDAEASEIATRFARLQDRSRERATVALNGALMMDGAVISIAPKTTLKKPLFVVFVRAGSETHMTAVRNVIHVGDHATATVVEFHVAVPGAAADAQSNAVSVVDMGEGSNLDHLKIAIDSGKSENLSHWDVQIGGDANYRAFQYTSGQALGRNDIEAVYLGENGRLDISGAYLLRDHEHVDTTLVVDHAVPHCESRELFKCVLDGASRGVFQGKVIVRPDAQKSDGKQMAQALMLSPDAEFDSKPELEIYADDVVCGHGSTTAELDHDLMFYCMSRGIPQTEARALLIESFIGEAIDVIANDEVRDGVMRHATEWLRKGAA